MASKPKPVESSVFRSEVRASGFSEVWTHSNDLNKFQQYGWRCTNKEDSYSNNTLVGNWNEIRWDSTECNKRKPIPNKEILEQWNSSYRIGYNKNDQKERNQQRLSQLEESKTTTRSFPRHQPEFDPLDYRKNYDYQSTSRLAYGTPSEEERYAKYKKEEVTGPIIPLNHSFLSQVDNATPRLD
ncbi:Oidioi.mRNA.OKI2018_I69.chr2.g7982.t1.cds [Oikopleura dioica]|uniref:Oidioi.mRNA.OKI2018_I69.chr2.g7982.t1.cds n=1 Tax=Oikopleura dioica TaxID=34765 RepID=A0ABN7TCE0_OIKDI|nr:Oidioi.mRNA.OKI2018_I69.chr2.g7982.t1.cds [Oikopleura dioica]